MPLALLIDTDPGIDDAVAIALAVRCPSLSVVAITTVFGNVEVERASRNAREVLRQMGVRAPVISGAARPLRRPLRFVRVRHGTEGLGFVHPARPALPEPDRVAEAITLLSRQYAGLGICCLGPLTNLARALQLDPSLRHTLGPVYSMGGAIHTRGTHTRWSEFNWWSDPEAAAAVLRAGLDLRLVTVDVSRQMHIPRAAIDALRSAARHDERARFWSDALHFYADAQHTREGVEGCILSDPLAIAAAAEPALVTWQDTRLTVSTTSDEYRGAVRETADGARASIATSVR
ncbi:MAG: nucleoside hydrolase, partial [Gemmatimonadaceae bacterium]